MTDHFSSGPRLVEPSGDPRRQAVDSLRGYAYQLYVSALAWLRLQSEERLYLEVAEDFAVVSREALEGVQVKDTSGSGRVTINSEDDGSPRAASVENAGRSRQERLIKADRSRTAADWRMSKVNQPFAESRIQGRLSAEAVTRCRFANDSDQPIASAYVQITS